MPIRDVAILALPGVQPFELGVAWEGFGIDRSDDGVPRYECAIVSEEPVVATSASPHQLSVLTPRNKITTARASVRTDRSLH